MKAASLTPAAAAAVMFVQSRKFTREHQRKQPGLFNTKGISVYGQESNETTWRLCEMNLAVHGIEGDIAWNPEGSFLRDAHTDLRADFVIANPPFNDSDWGGQLLRDDPRWKLGAPPSGNANYAWIQHFLHQLSPGGYAGFVMANGSLSSQQSGEGDIRRKMIEDDLVDCIVALPGQLFYSTGISVCLWFLAKNKAALGFRYRRGETLFINATKLGYLEDRTQRLLTKSEVARITEVDHRWRGTLAGEYTDVAGFCKAATTAEIASSDYVLTPERYCGSEAEEVDGEPFAEKMARLNAALEAQFTEAGRLETAIRANLGSIRHGK